MVKKMEFPMGEPHWFPGGPGEDAITTPDWGAVRSNLVARSAVHGGATRGFDAKKGFSEWLQQAALACDGAFGKFSGTDEELEFLGKHTDGMIGAMRARAVLTEGSASGAANFGISSIVERHSGHRGVATKDELG
jgi:hypothetical protein